MCHAPEHTREVFLEWLDAICFNQSSFKDSVIALDDKQVQIPKLLNSLANCTDMLPSDSAWIVEDYREGLLGKGAWRTYANAVKVVRRLRRQ